MSFETELEQVRNVYLVSKRTNRRYVLNGDLESDEMPEDEALACDFTKHMVIESSDLPPKVDLREWMTEVEDQSKMKSW